MHLPYTQNTPPKEPSGKELTGSRENRNPVLPPRFIKVLNNHTPHAFYLPKCDFFECTEKVGITEE